MHVGPGGVNCPCCGYGKTKDRRQFYTSHARRALKRELVDEIENDFEVTDEMIGNWLNSLDRH